MKLKTLFISTLLGLGSFAANAAEFTLTDAVLGTDVGNWKVTNKTLGFTDGSVFSIEKRQLHGGKQAGVDTIIINNGKMTITLIPTRGMGIFDVKMDGERILGWDSPVKEIVNPAFIELESRGGLGWLDGFNEMMVRCGYEWTGHPGVDDNGRLLACTVELRIHPLLQLRLLSTILLLIKSPFKVKSVNEPSKWQNLLP